jgi:transcriptional regulator with XRE-family HTH domain
MKCPYCDGSGVLSAPTVGALVVAARRGAGMTQIQVAERAMLSRAQIANLECDRTDIPLKTLARIADAIGCTMKDLVP